MGKYTCETFFLLLEYKQTNPIRNGTNKGKITVEEWISIRDLPSSKLTNNKTIPATKLPKIER